MDWAWTRWLPHVIGADEATPVTVPVWSSSTRRELVVPPAPRLAAGGIVLAPDVVALPSCCTHVATVADDATISLLEMATGTSRRRDRGRRRRRCRRPPTVARALAGFDDPELPELAAVCRRSWSWPTCSAPARSTASRWRRRGAPSPPTRPAPCAGGWSSPTASVEIDLVEHGPHALVAGTTGAGKSELLRTLVAGLAARSSPRDLTFVLIDYKGGSAFDACAALPHVVGMVTDLDDRLAGRALRSLEAELRRRERVLRAAGATDIAPTCAAEADRTPAPLPRLVVVVDELAGLAADLPDFVSSLVGVAQRGRSLGIHLVLATQRPAGVVNDDIRANTNLRIALRVQSAADSHDVLGQPDAAVLRADRPGRALVRLGVRRDRGRASGALDAGAHDPPASRSPDRARRHDRGHRRR